MQPKHQRDTGPVERLRRFAGKNRSQVSNPGLTARECIELANYMVELERKVEEAERNYRQTFVSVPEDRVILMLYQEVIYKIDGHSGKGVIIGRPRYDTDHTVMIIADEKAIGMPINVRHLAPTGRTLFKEGTEWRDRYEKKFGIIL